MARYSIDFYSKALLRKINIRVTIPSLNLQETLKNKDEQFYENRRDEKFPLIVALCGFGEDQVSWQTNTQIESLCEKHRCAAVYINGENKWYLNHGPLLDYYDLVERDVLDFVYGNFANLSREKPLIILGNSMGGYGALYHYLKNVDKYQACVALSPATKPDYLDESKYGTLKDLFLENKGKKMNVYLIFGEKYFIIDASHEFDEFLKENEVGVRYIFRPDYDHSWLMWKDEIFRVFDYLNKEGLIG